MALDDIGGLCRAVVESLEEGAEAIIAGGGDGTISQMARLALEHGVPLGILPLGSLNHFARDAGIPLMLEEALPVALFGRVERFDVGEVNGRSFVNNSSLGLYPRVMRVRAQHRVRGLAKWLVAVWATLREVARHREIAVRLTAEGQAELHRTPVVFVANNPYRAAGLEAGTRDSLQSGLLAIYIVRAGGRRHLLRLMWRVLRGRAPKQELQVLLTESGTVETGTGDLDVALDGEVVCLRSPLNYRIRPGALLVRVPPVPPRVV